MYINAIRNVHTFRSGYRMPYKKMYFCLFNAITDALRELEKHHTLSAKLILQHAQRRTEEMYMDGVGTENTED